MTALLAPLSADEVADVLAIAPAAATAPQARARASSTPLDSDGLPRMRVTAGAPLPVIVRCLSTSGWGALWGREWGGVRDVLEALAHKLGSNTATGTITAWQVSRVAALSVRWTRVCLQVLEDIGILHWERGGVIEGKPVVGAMRIDKKALVDIYRTARPANDQATRDRNQRTRARLAKLRKLRVPTQYPKRLPALHEEVSSALPSQGGGRASGPAAQPTPEEKAMRDTQPAYVRYLAQECPHTGPGAGDPTRCNQCRYMAMTHAGQVRQKEALRARLEAATPPPPTLFEEYMERVHPGAHPREWYRLAQGDPEAMALAKTTAELEETRG